MEYDRGGAATSLDRSPTITCGSLARCLTPPQPPCGVNSNEKIRQGSFGGDNVATPRGHQHQTVDFCARQLDTITVLSSEILDNC